MPVDGSRTTTPRRKPRSRKTDDIQSPTVPTPDQIRARAYQIYVERGQTPGDPGADWLQAEQELRARMQLLGQP